LLTLRLKSPHASETICSRYEHVISAVSCDNFDGVAGLLKSYPREALGGRGAELKNCLGKAVFVGQVAIQLNPRLHLATHLCQKAPCLLACMTESEAVRMATRKKLLRKTKQGMSIFFFATAAQRG
jgi:hypothetical protein